jgi:glycosidase
MLPGGKNSFLIILALVAASGAPAISAHGQQQEPQASTGEDKRVSAPKLAVPTWARDARWYHVCVPRFHNGDRSNDPPGTLPWTAIWPAMSPSTAAEAAKLDTRRYGGDLQGLLKRLPYLEDLGVNALYISSIFHGEPGATDKPVDLRHVDEIVSAKNGAATVTAETLDTKTWTFSPGDGVFLRFLKEAHKQGFRVAVEADFGEARKAMPDAAAGERHLLEITRRWMDPNKDGDPSDGVDGWVLTEPQSLPHKFWKRWRAEAKKVNPGVLLVGDIRGDARPWLAGDEFDVVVMHDAAEAIRRFMTARPGKYPLEEFFADLTAVYERYPLGAHLGALHPVSTFDTGRLLSALSRPVQSTGAGRAPETAAPDVHARARWRLATIMQHVFVGAPVTYYGDEAGMHGGPGPHARAPMWWNDLPGTETRSRAFQADYAALVQWLHARRQLHEPLRKGKFRVVFTDQARGLLAFARSIPGDEVALLINYGDAKQKVMLPVGKPGQMIGVLGPRLRPMPAPDPKSGKLIRPLGVGGSRRIVDDAGTTRIWINPMTVRLVIVTDEPPR